MQAAMVFGRIYTSKQLGVKYSMKFTRQL